MPAALRETVKEVAPDVDRGVVIPVPEQSVSIRASAFHVLATADAPQTHLASGPVDAGM
jgi:hypothetical protein